MKESESSIQTVLDSIFNPLSKKRIKELGLTEQDEGKYVARLYQEIDGCGRESAIATGLSTMSDQAASRSSYPPLLGCFGHYTSLRNYDANLSRHEKAGEWLVTFDLISASMYGDADFTLVHYLPYFLVPFYPLFQERGGERVQRNQADWDVRLSSTSTHTLSTAPYILLRDTASTDDEEQRGDIQIPLSWLAYRRCAPRRRL